MAQNSDKIIFINYRRDDNNGYFLAIYNQLVKWYGEDRIFGDFNTIIPGYDFEEVIDQALNKTSVLIVLINDKWSKILNDRGKSKNVNEPDFVRIEIAKALAKNIYCIPVTINGTPMPSTTELPEEIRKLGNRQFLNIDQTRFETDTLKLRNIIDKRLGIQRRERNFSQLIIAVFIIIGGLIMAYMFANYGLVSSDRQNEKASPDSSDPGVEYRPPVIVKKDSSKGSKNKSKPLINLGIEKQICDAKAYARNKQFNDAIAICKRIRKQSPDYFSSYNFREVDSFLVKNDVEKASNALLVVFSDIKCQEQ